MDKIKLDVKNAKQIKNVEEIKKNIVTEENLPESFTMAIALLEKAKEYSKAPLTEEKRKSIGELIQEAESSLYAANWFVTTPKEQREKDINKYLYEWDEFLRESHERRSNIN